MSKVSKLDLVLALEQLIPSQTLRDEVVTKLLGTMQEALTQGNSVMLLNIGTLTRKKVKGRKVLFGEAVNMPDKYVIKFTTSRNMTEQLADEISGKLDQQKSLEAFRKNIKKKSK